VLEQAEPALVVADFAPTAMLAARMAGVATACVGDGFSLPPLSVPLPDMRAWAGVAADEIDSVEGRVLAVINARLGAAGARGLRNLCDLFAEVPSFLCAFAELDHYAGRGDGAYYGAVFPPSAGQDAVWPAGEGRRVYVDLDPRHPALPSIVDVLDRLGLPSLVQGAGMAVGQADGLERRLVQVSGTANRAALLAGSDFVLCQAVDVVAPALLAGKPVLMLPVFVEQMMTLHRVAAQGLGHGVDPAADAEAIEAAVRRLAGDAGCRRRAVNFARAYDGYRVAIAIEAVVDEIGGLLAG
jgi:UDP:flavonoid glycosyltransferase YjiC (YdhE family)